MAIFRISNTMAADVAAAIIAKVDAGAGPATLAFYTGTIPASVDTAVTNQTLLGTLTCSDPCGSYAARTITFGAITQDVAADASGTATWARMYDSASNPLCDFDVTGTAGTGSIKLNTVDIIVGGPISMASLTITV